MIDCTKCKLSYENYCEIRRMQGCDSCCDCELFDEDNLTCKCVTLSKENDCPYFVEYEDE